MTRDEAVALIKKRLKRASDSDLDADIVAEMRHVQSQVLEKGPVFPWFLFSEEEEISLSADDTSATLPTGFITEMEEGEVVLQNVTDESKVVLSKTDYGTLKKLLDGESVEYLGGWVGDTPAAYALGATKVHFLPAVPDDGKTYKLLFPCIKRDTELSTNVENNWLKWAADVVIGETGKIIASAYLRDEAGTEIMAALAKEGWQRLWELHEQRKSANSGGSMEYS